jgi:hypothetical protein
MKVLMENLSLLTIPSLFDWEGSHVIETEGIRPSAGSLRSVGLLMKRQDESEVI